MWLHVTKQGKVYVLFSLNANLDSGAFTILQNITKPIFDEYGFVISATSEFYHHNYSEMERFLVEYNTSYPNITHLKSIGKSVKGKELYVISLSNTPEEHVPGEFFFLMSHSALCVRFKKYWK